MTEKFNLGINLDYNIIIFHISNRPLANHDEDIMAVDQSQGNKLMEHLVYTAGYNHICL